MTFRSALLSFFHPSPVEPSSDYFESVEDEDSFYDHYNSVDLDDGDWNGVRKVGHFFVCPIHGPFHTDFMFCPYPVTDEEGYETTCQL